MNTLGDHIRARRIDLGLLQSQVAEQIGVHEATITNWEGNASRPAVQYIPAIIRFLGFDPSAKATSFSERLIAVRRSRGLTQMQMATALGVNPSTILEWETGQHQPSRKKRELIAKALSND